MTRLLLMCVAVLFLFSLECRAIEIVGVELPDTAQVNGKNLVLNGAGIRKATFFKVKVYVAGLYLEKKSSNAKEIIDSNETKQIRMQFVRDVGSEKLQSGWQEAIANNNSNLESLQAKIDRFNSYMVDLQEKDQIVINFDHDAVGVQIKGREMPQIEGNDFARALISVWLGSNPPNADLKTGMLGQS